MTDEEMADVYFKSVCKDYNEEKERTGERHYWVGFDLKNAFLAGLKAGRLKWHKDKYSHSENDKLLPCGKVEGYYRVILYDNYKEPQIIRPETEIEFVGNQREHIIAWCEIPKYTKE